jgi:hypothetical protein
MMHSFGPLRHLNLWSVAAFDTNGGGGDGSRGTPDSSARGADMSVGAKKNTAYQNVKMDLGLEPKNSVYYRDLAARQEASKAAAASFSNKSDDGPGRSSAAPVSTASTSTSASPELTPDVQAASSNVQDMADAVTGGVGADTASVGGAEDEVLEGAKKGRQSTILTKPAGLLSVGDDEKTRRRRSLIGG